MRADQLTNKEISWWLMRQLLTVAMIAAALLPVAAAGWLLVADALDAEATNRQAARLAEAPKVATTMRKIASLRPSPRVCDIDLQGGAQCETFTKQGERRVIRIAGDQP